MKPMRGHITKDTVYKESGFLFILYHAGNKKGHVPKDHKRNHTEDRENQLETTSQMVESVKEKEHDVLRDEWGV